MEKNNVLVSVIVPCYNQAQYLAETLDSVLAQTYPYWECIIVNDGSPDNTEEIANEYCAKDSRFHYYYKENSGLADTRNYGISKSNGRYILPLDSDDIIGTKYLEKAINHLENNKDTKLVYCKAEFFGERVGLWHLPEYDYHLLLKENHIFCSCIFRREDFNKTKGYNPNMKYGFEDWDFLLSFLEPDDMVYRIDEVLFYYRIKVVSRSTELLPNEKKMREQLLFNHPDKYLALLDDVSYGDYKNQYLQIRSSKAYRLGKFILKPFKKIKQLFKL